MSNDYTGISARCEVEAARPGDEAGRELLSDGEFAVVLSDHGNDTIVVIEGTPAELLALLRRARQALEEQVNITGAAIS